MPTITIISHTSIIIIIIIIIVVAVLLCVSLPLPFSLSQPNWSKQMAAHVDPGSAQGFFLLKGSFSLAAVAKCLLMGECWVSVN